VPSVKKHDQHPAVPAPFDDVELLQQPTSQQFIKVAAQVESQLIAVINFA
jgi:hypothetical protein